MIRWNTWPLRRDPEWTRRPGASPPDAHACIMVLVPIDQPNTSLRRDIASRAGSPRKSSSCRQRHLLVSTSSLAPGSRRSRAASLRDGPMATLDRHSARTPSRLEVETRRCRPPSNKGDDRNDLTTIPLDHAPYKYSRDGRDGNGRPRCTGYPAGACRRARRRRDLVAGHDGSQVDPTRNPDRSIMFPSATQNLDLNCSNFQSSIHLKFN